MIFYRVTTRYKTDGSVDSRITASCTSESKPANTHGKISDGYMYCDWFPTYEKAIECVEKAYERRGELE